MSKPHSQATSIHKGAYIQSSDPGSVGANILWLDTTSGFVLKKRNSGNTGWDTVADLLVSNDQITNAKLANMVQATIKGRAVGAGTGDPTDLTGTQVTTILDPMVGDSGSGGTKGLVPAPAAGDAAAEKFLKADGTFAVPTVGSGSLANDSVTNAKLADMANATVKGRTTAGTGDPEDLSMSQLYTLIKSQIELELEVAASDESTALTTGTSKLTFYWPFGASVTEIFIGLTAQSTSGSVTVDVNKNGTTVFSTNPSIDANEDTNLTGTVGSLSSNPTSFSKGDKITIDIDAAGTGAKGLKVIFIYKRA
jgi:hypothetical protein